MRPGARHRWAGLFVVLGVAAASPLVAATPTGIAGKFALSDPARAASLSSRMASDHTRAVLLRGTANLGKSAKPLAWIDGEASSVIALQELPIILDLALSWRLGWDATEAKSAARAARYRDAALQWLEAWVRTCRPNFMPLNESRLDYLILSWDLLKAGASAELDARMAVWLRNLAEGYLRDRNGQPGAEKGNCWQSHRIKLAVLAAFSLGDEALIAAAEAAFRRQLELNLFSDGSPRDFAEHDSLAYAVYDLQPLVMAALAAQAHGRDWYHLASRNGQNLEKALLWLSNYAAGRQNHAEFVYSMVEAERQQASAKPAKASGFGQLWNPVNACALYWLAVRLDDRWLALAARLGRDQSWLAVIMPTADPPVYSMPSPKASASPKTASSAASGTSSTTTAASNQAQLTALLQAIQGGSTSTAATSSSTTGLPSLLSLLDTLGASNDTSSTDSNSQ